MNNFKKQCEDIPVPDNIDLILRKAIRKERYMLKSEMKSSWIGFLIINLLIIMTAVVGMPITYKSTSPSVQMSKVLINSNFSDIIIILLVTLLTFGIYLLFREVYLKQIGSISLQPTDTWSILKVRVKCFRYFTLGSLIILFVLGFVLNFYSLGVINIANFTSFCLATLALEVILTSGFKSIASSYRAGRTLVLAAIRGFVTIIIGLIIMWFIFMVFEFLLAYVDHSVKGNSITIVALVAAFVIGKIFIVVSKSNIAKTADNLEITSLRGEL